MNVLGHGVDTVDAVRFGRLFQDGRHKYLDRYFSENELRDLSPAVDSKEPGWELKIAARFAAKEAVMKAIEHGFGEGLGFTDIEIQEKETGAPTAVLKGKALEEANVRGIRQWWINISHSGNVAFASAIACG